MDQDIWESTEANRNLLVAREMPSNLRISYIPNISWCFICLPTSGLSHFGHIHLCRQIEWAGFQYLACKILCKEDIDTNTTIIWTIQALTSALIELHHLSFQFTIYLKVVSKIMTMWAIGPYQIDQNYQGNSPRHRNVRQWIAFHLTPGPWRHHQMHQHLWERQWNDEINVNPRQISSHRDSVNLSSKEKQSRS